MSNFIELSEGTLVNLDNVTKITKNNAKNGGTPMLMISYVDCIGCPVAYKEHKDMCVDYNKIKANKTK